MRGNKPAPLVGRCPGCRRSGVEISAVAFGWSVRPALFTSCATTAKPRPASPARAASMVALSASMLVCPAMSEIRLTMPPIFSAAVRQLAHQQRRSFRPARPLRPAIARDCCTCSRFPSPNRTIARSRRPPSRYCRRRFPRLRRPSWPARRFPSRRLVKRLAVACNCPAASDTSPTMALTERSNVAASAQASSCGPRRRSLRRVACGLKFARLAHAALEHIERPGHGADFVPTIDTGDLGVQVAGRQSLQRLRRGADRQDKAHDQRESHAAAERDAHRQGADERRAGGGETRLALFGGLPAAPVGEGDILVQNRRRPAFHIVIAMIEILDRLVRITGAGHGDGLETELRNAAQSSTKDFISATCSLPGAISG